MTSAQTHFVTFLNELCKCAQKTKYSGDNFFCQVIAYLNDFFKLGGRKKKKKTPTKTQNTTTPHPHTATEASGKCGGTVSAFHHVLWHFSIRPIIIKKKKVIYILILVKEQKKQTS